MVTGSGLVTGSNLLGVFHGTGDVVIMSLGMQLVILVVKSKSEKWVVFSFMNSSKGGLNGLLGCICS